MYVGGGRCFIIFKHCLSGSDKIQRDKLYVPLREIYLGCCIPRSESVRTATNSEHHTAVGALPARSQVEAHQAAPSSHLSPSPVIDVQSFSVGNLCFH